MQIVSRHILEDLVRQKAVFEDDSHETSTFSEILSEMRKFIDKGKKLSYPGYLIPWKPYECVEDEIHYAHEMVLKKFLKGNSMVKYVGAGSSRTAFALAGGKCLKIANSKKGVAQNKQEVLNSQDKYTCFPILYEFDDKDFSMILVECCSQLSSRRNASDFKKAFGLSMPYDLVASLTDIVNTSKCDIDDAIEMLQYAEDTGKYAYGKEEDQYCVSFNIRKEFCLMVRDSNAPQFEVIRQLVKFYSDHGKNDNQCIISDLQMAANWGLAARDGKLVPIVIDSGFSREVESDFY